MDLTNRQPPSPWHLASLVSYTALSVELLEEIDTTEWLRRLRLRLATGRWPDGGELPVPEAAIPQVLELIYAWESFTLTIGAPLDHVVRVLALSDAPVEVPERIERPKLLDALTRSMSGARDRAIRSVIDRLARSVSTEVPIDDWGSRRVEGLVEDVRSSIVELRALLAEKGSDDVR